MTQVDRVAGLNQGLALKAPVVTSTIAAITLSGLQTVDGVTLKDGDRVLVKNQADKKENGIYIARPGTWERAPDFNGQWDAVKGTLVVRASSGSTVFYRLDTDDPVVIGTSDITFNTVGFPAQGISPTVVTATQGQTTFNTPAYTVGGYNLAVYLNGTRQIVSTDYTETNSTSITLTNPAVVGDKLMFVVNEVDSGTVTNTMQTEALSATSNGQTVFNLSSLTYTPGTNQLEVFHNGSLLRPSTDYTETDSTTFTITASYAAQITSGDTLFCRSNSSTTTNTVSSQNVSFLPSGTGATSRSGQDKLREIVSVKDFGAKGDGATDDTAAIQAAIDAVGIGGRVYFPAGVYITSSKIELHSQTTYIGDGSGVSGTVIKNTTSNEPVLVSKAYYAANSVSPTGAMTLRGIRIQGTHDNAKTANHGVLLYDYYSVLEDIEVYQCGGHGIYVASKNDQGTSPSSLVENKLSRCIARLCGKASFQIGDGGGVVTDGDMSYCISQVETGVDNDAHYDGWFDGWKVNNIRGYGGQPSNGAVLRQGFEMQASNIQISSFRDIGFKISGGDRSSRVDGLVLQFNDNNAGCIGVMLQAQSGKTPTLYLTGIKFHRDTGTNSYTAFNINGDCTVDFGNMLPVFEGSTITTNRTVWSNFGTIKGFYQEGLVQMAAGTATVTFDIPMPDSGYGIAFGTDTAGTVRWSSNSATGFTITHSGGGTEWVGWRAFEV